MFTTHSSAASSVITMVFALLGSLAVAGNDPRNIILIVVSFCLTHMWGVQNSRFWTFLDDHALPDLRRA